MENNDKYIGQLLDGRYEIIEKIGEGGMAVVYKALCHRLNRYVAVKILKDELALDDDFLRRFHTESQAVAMLSHPNIVTVYDVSRSSDCEYIVMELIEGITLKQYMQRRGALTWKEVLHFSGQIAKALSHAHSRGIIHRDIKPHNILILADSSVKVADFGIARLTNLQDTLTNETLGSVHYISPEQAKGGHIDSRTDIYSLGVMMYEMLTGRLPFEGDSAVSIAIQHISSVPLAPREINPEVPVGLEQITMKAMEPDLDKRYQSADELVAELEYFRKNPDENFDYSEREIIDTLNPPEKRTEAGFDNPMIKPDFGRERNLSKEEYKSSSRRARKVSALVGLLCVLGFLIVAFVFLWNYWLHDLFSTPETMDVPNLVGSKVDDVLINPSYTDYFNIIPSYEPNDEYESGYIFEQAPVAGRNVIKSDRKIDIKVVVSNGEDYLTMPGLVNTEYRQATLSLQQMKLTVEVTTVSSYDVTENYIISTIPEAGARVYEGDTVYLTVSAGPEIKYVNVPSLVGRTVEAAKSMLESSKLTVGSIETVEDDAPEGQVIFQSSPEGTEVAEHTKINLSVSAGRKPEPTEEIIQPPEVNDEPVPSDGGMLSPGGEGEGGGEAQPEPGQDDGGFLSPPDTSSAEW